MDIFKVTDTGNVRAVNEDCIYVSDNKQPMFAIVADGMGGHKGGCVASRMTIEMITEALSENPDISGSELSDLIKNISNAVRNKAKSSSDLENMGCTVVMAVINLNKAIIANIGDSRAYMISEHSIRQISKDHSYVQSLIDKGKITAEEAATHPLRNVITLAVGIKDAVPDIFEEDFPADNTLVFCSDGLTRHVNENEILEAVSNGTAIDAGEKLLKLALERGGMDNISVIIIKNEKDD